LAETADDAKLSLQWGFQYAQDEILGFIAHSGIPGMSRSIGMTWQRRSVTGTCH